MANSATYTAIDAAEITKSDTTVYDPPLRAVWVGGGTGTLKVRMVSGNDCTFTGVAGVLIPIACDMIYSTTTDATGIVGLY
ncbi:MAG: hypothetical protein WBN07_12060 [Woeseiaceae bacterium]